MGRPFLREREHPKQGEVATLGLLHELAVARAVKEFEIGHRREPYITPFLWLIRYPNDLVVLETPWANDAEKVKSFAAVRELMQATGATAYSFIHESWMAVFEGPEEVERSRKIYSVRAMPKDQREDVLLILSADLSGAHLTTRYGIARADTPHAKLKLRDDMPTPDGMLGRLSNFLKPEKPDVDKPAQQESDR